MNRLRLRHRLHWKALDSNDAAHYELSIGWQGCASFCFLLDREPFFLADAPLAAEQLRLFEALDLSRQGVRGHVDGGLHLETALFSSEKGAVGADGNLDYEAAFAALGLAAHINDRVVGNREIAGQLVQVVGGV